MVKFQELVVILLVKYNLKTSKVNIHES